MDGPYRDQAELIKGEKKRKGGKTNNNKARLCLGEGGKAATALILIFQHP